MVVYKDYGEKKKNPWRETDLITVPSDHELTALTTRPTSCHAYAFNMYDIGIDPYVKIYSTVSSQRKQLWSWNKNQNVANEQMKATTMVLNMLLLICIY